MNINSQVEKEFTLPKTQKLRHLVANFTATEWVIFLGLVLKRSGSLGLDSLQGWNLICWWFSIEFI